MANQGKIFGYTGERPNYKIHEVPTLFKGNKT